MPGLGVSTLIASLTLPLILVPEPQLSPSRMAPFRRQGAALHLVQCKEHPRWRQKGTLQASAPPFTRCKGAVAMQTPWGRCEGEGGGRQR